MAAWFVIKEETVLLWGVTVDIGMFLFTLQAFFAYRGKMLTPVQMVESGVPQGIPFTGHGSTWWVLCCLIPLMATLVALYADQWSGMRWLLALVVGIIVSGGMHYLYTLAPYPDFMVTDKKLNGAGWSHFALFTGAIAVLVLVFTSTTHTYAAIPVLTAMYMVWHVFVGNHMLRKMNPPDWFPPYPLWDIVPWGSVAAVAIILGGATMFALR